MNKEKVYVYGLGTYFYKNEKLLLSKFDVIEVFDKNKKGMYEGKPINLPEDMHNFTGYRTIIMVENIQMILEIADNLHDVIGIPIDKIVIGLDIFSNELAKNRGLSSIKYTGNNQLLIKIRNFECFISSLDEYNNLMEVLGDEIYNYYLNDSKKEIVLDIGMNIGDATLYFAEMEKVEKVISFEPFKNTYLKAQKNINYCKNPNKGKITAYNYGLSDVEERRKIIFNKNMSCGMSTICDIAYEVEDIYLKNGLIEKKDSQEEIIEVKSASNVISKIMHNNPNNNFVMKIDCEGEEYSIVRNLSEKGLLDKFRFIMLEWHYKGKEELINYLLKANFSFWCVNESDNIGLIYAFKG